MSPKNALRAATAAAVLAVCGFALAPAAAQAATATANSGVNVRSGPSTSAPIIGHLYAGERVDVGGCRNGWCYLTDERGFVSSRYLRNGSVTMQPDFNLSFNFPQGSFSIGTGGVGIGIGTPPRPGYPGDNFPGGGNGPGGDVCFYSGANYTGDRLCLDRGESLPYVGRGWNNRISSIRNRGGYRVTVCDDAGFDICRTYTSSAAYLGSFDNRISSIRVR